jgi:hypothetical protein
MAADAPVPSWFLIAVLQSTIPLGEALAIRLYHAAIELHRREGDVERLTGDLATGEVRRLGQTLGMGTIFGPAFEADLVTPSGTGHVRFLLTHRAIEMAEESSKAEAN